MNILPLAVFEEIVKYLDLKSFVALLSLSKGIKEKILSSNAKIKGLELLFTKGIESKMPGKYRLYTKYKRHFTNNKVTVEDVSLEDITDKAASTIISAIEEIHTLDLSNCDQITSQWFFGLSKLSRLQSLIVSDCIVTDRSLEGIAKLVNLEHLNLTCCDKITDKGVGEIATKLINLRFLDLSYCRVTDEGVKELAKLVNLRRLKLYGCNKITNKFIEDFTKRIAFKIFLR